MAQLDILSPFIFSFEGGFSNHPNDSGGPTNKGITLKTWLNFGRDINEDGSIDVNDLKLITSADAEKILRKYWNKCQADKINSQAIANLLVSWYWGSGGIAIRKIQELLNSEPCTRSLLEVDGIMGPKTLKAINKADPITLFYDYKQQKQLYLKEICQQNPKNKVFLRGWLRRLNCIQYSKLICNDGTEIIFDKREY